jgi:DNA-binding XRE family transcriptional regulator
MDPERNHGGKPSPSGDDAATVDAVLPPVEPRMVPRSAALVPNEAADAVPVPSDAGSVAGTEAGKKSRRTRLKAGSHPNNVRKLRQGAMMSKAELARRAGVSPLTIDRVEAGCPCRMDTKRKILEALGLQPSAARDVFPDLDQP